MSSKVILTTYQIEVQVLIIEQTFISIDDKYISDWSELYDILEIPDSIKSHSNDILLKRVIKPNEDFQLIDWTHNPDLMKKIYKESHRLIS